jgi:Tol biopolymer transport system component
MVATFDAERLELGSPRRLVDGLYVSPSGNNEFAISPSGTMVYRAGNAGPGDGELVWVSRGGAVEVVDPSLSGIIEAPAISPDGRRIAFERGTGSDREIWIYDVAGRTSSRLTLDGEGGGYRAAWSPDGSELTFVSNRDGSQSIWRQPSDRSAPARLMRAPSAGDLWEGFWTPDGRSYVYRQLPRTGVGHFYVAAPDPDSLPVAVHQSEYFNTAMSLSPDGRWLAYQSNETGRSEVFVRPFPGGGGARLVSQGGGMSPRWARNGNEIFYVAGDSTFTIARVRTAPDFTVESREVFASSRGYLLTNLIQRFDLDPGGQRILAIRSRTGDVPVGDVVVTNVFEELRALTAN